MQGDKKAKYYQWLELDSGATPEQVEVAYRQLLRRYGPGCLASYGLLRVEERRKFLHALKDAYQKLSQRPSAPPGSSGAPDEEAPTSEGPLMGKAEREEQVEAEMVHAVASMAQGQASKSKLTGQTLRESREKNNMSLDDLAQLCGCSQEVLLQLERGEYAAFASSSAMRGVIETYAQQVGVDVQRALADNLSAYWNSRSQPGWSKSN